MRRSRFAYCLVLLLVVGCSSEPLPPTPAVSLPSSPAQRGLLAERAGHTTRLIVQERDDESPVEPPAELFQLVQYDGPLGKMNAYLGVTDPAEKRPAIIWLTGGFSNGISPLAWEEVPAENDQSARQYREAGLVMMYPTRRGGSGSPGHVEVLYGEVDDVIAAGEWLARQPGIDPDRIYLGGHSTGGALALLVAEATGMFRAVFSFGPIENPYYYGPNYMIYYDFDEEEEHRLRSPIHWLGDIKSRTFVLEGVNGNADSVQVLDSECSNPAVSFHLVPRADHFNILAPINTLIAAKVVADTGDDVAIEITHEELARAME